MTTLGNVSVWLALLLGVWGSGSAVLGTRRLDAALRRSAERVPAALCGVLAVALISMGAGVVRQDLNLAVVASYATRAMPLQYALAAVGISPPGMVLALAWAVSLFAAGSLITRDRLEWPTRFAGLESAIGAVAATALLLLRPFARLGYTPLEGRGLLPVPRHPLALVEIAILTVGLAALLMAVLYAAADRTQRRSSAFQAAAWVLLSAGVGLRLWRGHAVLELEGATGWRLVTMLAWVLAGAALLARPRRDLGQVVSLLGLGLVVVIGAGSAILPERVILIPTGGETEMHLPVGSVRVSNLGVSRFEVPGGLTTAATLTARRGAGPTTILTAERRQYVDVFGHQVGGYQSRPAVLHGWRFDLRIVYQASSGPALPDEAVYVVRAWPLVWCVWLGFALMSVGGLLAAGRAR